MKILANENNENIEKEGGLHMIHEHRGPVHHIPPHERKAIVRLEYDEQDWSLMKDIFGDEDTAAAVATIIREAPPEIQILAVQLINVIKEVA